MRLLTLLITLTFLLHLGSDGCAPPVRFTDATLAAGFDYRHDFADPGITAYDEISGGVAAGDVDGDGFVDLFVVRGTVGPALLFLNQGDGTFVEGAEAAGLVVEGRTHSGPVFADWDGDGDVDLFVGGVEAAGPRLFRNRGDGTFEETTAGSGIATDRHTFSAAFADADGDGALDVFLSHWGSEIGPGSSEHLFLGDGAGGFHDASVPSGVRAAFPVETDVFSGNTLDFTFTPNWTDIDGDGDPDLLLTSDFGTSQVLRNLGDGTFVDVTPAAITDENGMGAAVGDYDNDGDLDWFVTSILDPDGQAEGNWGVTGNRLYRNDGSGGFEDVTDEAGVRHGFWGWGACFADFDNDGWLDLFHVNGINMAVPPFDADPSRLFLSNGDGSFREAAQAAGIEDLGNGRGVVCMDADRDGDVDLFVANTRGEPRYYRNDTGSQRHWLSVRLEGAPGNGAGVGAWVRIKADYRYQLREIRAGSNFVSNDPAEAHFGLGDVDLVSHVEVSWPDGARKTLRDVAADQHIVVRHPGQRTQGKN